MNIPLDSKIEKLDFGEEYIKLLKEKNIFNVYDLWCKSAKDLKQLKFSDKEIKYFSIKLQLWGLDLGKKMYDR